MAVSGWAIASHKPRRRSPDLEIGLAEA